MVSYAPRLDTDTKELPMLGLFRRAPEPIVHDIFGRLVWSPGKRSEGAWQGRVAFPPTGDDIAIWIPGGRKKPMDVVALYRGICESFGTLRPQIQAGIERECTDAGRAMQPLQLTGLYFFSGSPDDGEWKLVYRMGEREVHVDTQGVGTPCVFLPDA